MLSPKSDDSGDDSSPVIAKVENNFGNENKAPPIGWNIENKDGQIPDNPIPGYLKEIHLSHKQISKRFTELLNLFEDYTKLLDSEHMHHVGVPFRLKRVLSEQLALKAGEMRSIICTPNTLCKPELEGLTNHFKNVFFLHH